MVARCRDRSFKSSPSLLSVAVSVAGLTLAGVYAGGASAQQANVVISTDQLELLLIDSNFPNGATILIEEGVTVGVIDTFVTSTASYDITINGQVPGTQISSLVDFSNSIPNASSLTVGENGQVGSLFMEVGASIVNNGLIESIPDNNLTNLDAIFQKGSFQGNGLQVGGFSLVNNGTIRGIGASAVVADSIETIEITNTGFIEVTPPPTGVNLNRGSLNAFELSASESVLVTNSGTISAGLSDPNNLTAVFNNFFGELDPATTLVNPVGTFELQNLEGGVIEGQRIFTNFLTSNNTAPYVGYQLTVNNAGTMRAGGLAFGVRGATDFTNSGSIIADTNLGAFTGDPSTAIVSHFATPGRYEEEALTFTNTATGTLAAPVIIGFTSGVITNEGLMDSTSLDQFGAGGVAIRAGQFFDPAVPADPAQWVDSVEINNSGDITALLIGVESVDGISELVVNNSGTIRAATGVRTANGRLSLTNEDGGFIESTIGSTAILSFSDRTDPGLNFSDTIVNDGTVIGNIDLGAGDDSLTNRGTIEGDVLLGDGDDTMISSGTVDGSVFMGDGDDLFIAEGGTTITGSVDGGAGFDTIRLVDISFAGGPNALIGVFNGFDAATVEGTFNLGGDGVASDISLTAPDLVFEPGTIFVVDAFEDGTSDILRNSGSIALNGGQVQALSPDGAWSVRREYTIIQADGGLTGTFDSVTSNLDYLIPELSYTANSVILSLEREDSLIQGDILETTNAQQLSVAARIVPRIIQSQVAKSMARALGASAPASAVVAAPVSVATGLSAGDDTDATTGASGSLWLNLTPSRYDQRALLPGAEGPQEIDGEAINFLTGVDRLLGSRFVAGAYLGYEDSEVEYRAISGFQDGDGFMVGAYAGVAFNEWLYSSINANWAQLDNSLEERAFDTADVQRADFDSERLTAGIDLTASIKRDKLGFLAQVSYLYSEETYDPYTTNRGEVVQLADLSLGRFSVNGEVSYQGDNWNPYIAVSYESDNDVSDTVSDDNGFVINGGVRARYGTRFSLEAYVATVEGRDNDNQQLVGLNVNYAF